MNDNHWRTALPLRHISVRETKKRGTFVPLFVPRPGVEPGWVAPLVFETSASTDSAIWASFLKDSAKVIPFSESTRQNVIFFQKNSSTRLHISMSDTNASPMPRTIRTNTSFMASVRLGHAAHYTERACDGGEHCDENFEELPSASSSDASAQRIWSRSENIRGMVIWKKNKTSRNTVCYAECNVQAIILLCCHCALFTLPEKNFSPKALHGSHFMRTFVVYSFYFYICLVFYLLHCERRAEPRAHRLCPREI